MIKLEGISKVYTRGNDSINALSDISLHIAKGEMVAVTGPSGSGKSTLMNIIGCIDCPTSGNYELSGVSVSKLWGKRACDFRREMIGFIFQDFNLIPHMTAVRNVELPLMICRLSGKERRQRAEMALDMVGLSDRRAHLPSELSGGQMQRVAIARVIASDPPVIVADEPTGNLDPESAAKIIDILEDMNAKGKTVILITHDINTAKMMPRRVIMEKGKIKEDRGESRDGEKRQDQLLP